MDRYLSPLIDKDIDEDGVNETSMMIPLQSAALVSHDSSIYLYPILLLLSCLSATKLFDDSNNYIISGRITDSFMYASTYWRYFICGAISCSISHVATVPFDVIKTKIQTDSQKDKNNISIVSSSVLEPASDSNLVVGVATTSTSLNNNNNMFAMTKKVIVEEGFSGLFTGIVPTFIGFSIQGAFKYGFFEVFKPLIKSTIIAYHTNAGDDDSISSLFTLSQLDNIVILILAAAFAEFIGSFFLTPFEAIRIRLVASSSIIPTVITSDQSDNPRKKDNIITFINTIIDNEGISSLFLGLPAIMLKAIPYTAVQLSCFELCSSAFYQTLFDAGTILPYLQLLTEWKQSLKYSAYIKFSAYIVHCIYMLSESSI